MSPPAAKRSTIHLDVMADDRDVPEALLRRLLHTVAGQSKQDHPATGETIELEVVMDGARFRLLRKQLKLDLQAFSLSPRELEVSRLIAKGHVNKTIARVLDISYHTVDTYLRRIFSKLNVTSRAAMVAKLSDLGLLSEPCPPSAGHQTAASESECA